ncbi:MAG: hypothetical protein U5N86_05775 [Planctomycetota bacterium]|nr:hypothetical protein [Planctomycetota bacterium]
MRMLVIVTLILLAAVFSGCVPQGDRHRQEDMPAEAKMSQAAADRFDMLLWQAEDYHTPDEYEEAMAELRKKVQMAENDFPSTDPSRWEYVYTVAVMVSGSAEEVSARIEKHASEYPSSDWTARALLAYADEKFDGSRYSEARGVYSRLLRDFSDYRLRPVT